MGPPDVLSRGRRGPLPPAERGRLHRRREPREPPGSADRRAVPAEAGELSSRERPCGSRASRPGGSTPSARSPSTATAARALTRSSGVLRALDQDRVVIVFPEGNALPERGAPGAAPRRRAPRVQGPGARHPGPRVRLVRGLREGRTAAPGFAGRRHLRGPPSCRRTMTSPPTARSATPGPRPGSWRPSPGWLPRPSRSSEPSRGRRPCGRG